MELPNGKRLLKATQEDFRTFWSGYRWCQTLAMFLAVPALQVLRHGWHSMLDIHEALENGIVGIIAALIGTFLLALWRGAKALDAGLQTTIQERSLENEQQRHENQELKNKLAAPPVSPLEQNRRDFVKDKLKQFSPEGIELIKYVLQNGEVDPIAVTLRAIPGAEYPVRLKLEQAVHQAFDLELFKSGPWMPGGRHLAKVNPELRDAMSFHLL